MGSVESEAKQWLFAELLPLWSANGLDPAGGYHDQLDDAGGALDLPKRCRVQARQIYVFAEAGRLGWQGPWRQCVDHGLAFMRQAFIRPDGLVRAKVSAVGPAVDNTVDNYDQAFTLFALANAYAVTADAALIELAAAILTTLCDRRRHPSGGFHESEPPSQPLRSNPHMHLLEAAIAWTEAAGLEQFRILADEIANLAATRFIDPASGALREYFDLDWAPLHGERGAIAEPGHQFEWAWLLDRWRRLGGAIDPAVPRCLWDFANSHGLDARRNVAINEVYVDGSVRDSTARLWPQTERLKAVIVMAEPDDRGQAIDQAWRGLEQYRLAGRPGRFRDKMRSDGTFIEEPSFASSVYHITCAISELLRFADQNSDKKR